MKASDSLNTTGTNEFTYVQESAALEALIQRIGMADRIAVDTEADSLHNYFEKVCLVQLSFAGEHYLVDPLAGLDLGGFLPALAEKPLIFHGGDYDLRMLRASFDFRPHREVFDTMIAAQLLGIEAIGLAALIERYFAVTIGKEGQKSDWSRRPLSEQQLHYAVNDTLFLERLSDRLSGELTERGRQGWHGESCRAMVESTERDRARDPEDVWRIKGAGRMTPRQLAYLREVWRWRDEHARRANRPAFKIFGNQQIFEVVQWAETHPGVSLEQGPKLPRNIRGTLLTTMEAAIARAAGMSPGQWPERKRGERVGALSNDDLEKLTALRGACAAIATELEIAASTLAPKAALDAIVRSRPRTVEEMVERSGLLCWQAELVQGAVEKCLF